MGMDRISAGRPPTAAAAQLERHALARDRGAACVAVLCGDLSAAVTAWSAWHQGRARAWTISAASDRDSLLTAYLSALLTLPAPPRPNHRRSGDGRPGDRWPDRATPAPCADLRADLCADIGAYLAPYAGVDADELGLRLSRQRPTERASFFRGLESQVDAEVLAVCERLVTAPTPASVPLAPETVATVAALRRYPTADRQLGDGDPRPPSLLLIDRAEDGVAWLREAAASALELAACQPGFAIGVAVSAERFAACLAASGDSYVMARVRAGRIDITPTPAAAAAVAARAADAAANIDGAIDTRAADAAHSADVARGIDHPPTPPTDPSDTGGDALVDFERNAKRTRGALERAGHPASVLDDFDEAARLMQAELARPALGSGGDADRASAADGASVDDRARSAAERLLARVLDDHPETRGRFELNRTLPIAFGPRDVEIDLLSTSLAIAVEVDGYYHFRDADAYRRDRRKDLLLQRAGLLVVRCLATDVVERLDEVMAAILEAVHNKTAPPVMLTARS
ncbi:MAG: hypothetical protein Tsb0020_46330 [Haliangiales bacterium]